MEVVEQDVREALGARLASAREQVDVVPKQAGNVVRVLVEEGARVTEGDVVDVLPPFAGG